MPAYTEYTYERGNVNNPASVFPAGHMHEGAQKFLSKDIEESFPGKKFLVRCEGTDLCVLFEVALTAGEKTTLDTVISNHKAVV